LTAHPGAAYRQAMLRLRARDSEIDLAPDCGGGIAAWRWRGLDLLRPGDPDGGPLALGCFPLVPFSNRIAGGRFSAGNRLIQLPANHRQGGRAQTIHGFGWQSRWDVVRSGPDFALLRHDFAASAWPWPYRAEQHIVLRADGLSLTMALTNMGDTPMPAGLGLHPYFPKPGARLDLAVAGRWEVDADQIPASWTALTAMPDWFGGTAIDHGFTGRRGPICIHWPTHQLTMTPDPLLSHVVVYVPSGADYFCVEPVSHMTNAVNRSESADETGLHWLAPGATLRCHIDFAVELAVA
jgi:aldose 1-epimerase